MKVDYDQLQSKYDKLLMLKKDEAAAAGVSADTIDALWEADALRKENEGLRERYAELR